MINHACYNGKLTHGYKLNSLFSFFFFFFVKHDTYMMILDLDRWSGGQLLIG